MNSLFYKFITSDLEKIYIAANGRIPSDAFQELLDHLNHHCLRKEYNMINNYFPEIKFYDLGTIDESLFTRAVIVSNYKGKWVYVKHKERDSWEIPGGKIEPGETPIEAARRELYEETGAIKFNIEPICIYSISTYALLCYATIEEFEELPESEIKEISFFDDQPDNLTYPAAHSKMFNKVREVKGL